MMGLVVGAVGVEFVVLERYDVFVVCVRYVVCAVVRWWDR
jgi:hypothetical protein